MPKRKSVLDLLLHRPPLTLSPLAINAPVPEASLSPEPSLKQFIGCKRNLPLDQFQSTFLSTETKQCQRCRDYYVEAAKHLLWMKRLLNSIEFDAQHDLILSCDNKQTIDLMTKPSSSYQTKLRHVDINKH